METPWHLYCQGMNSTDLAHWRMHSLRLSGPPFERLEDAVHWLGVVQSQDYGPAKWSIGARTAALSDAAIERAYADGAVLRTHILRPTWHFVLPADIRWMQALTASRVYALSAYYHRQLELDQTILARCHALFAAALQGGNYLTRAQLAAVLERDGIPANGQRLGLIIMSAELNAVICSGAPHGKQQTYALLDERAPHTQPLTRDEALAELTLRYFTSHGPATVNDCKWWCSLTVADIKRGLALSASRLQNEVIDGVPYWFGSPAPSRTPASPAVHLLQGFDEYTVAYSESKSVLDVSGAARLLSRERPVYNQIVFLDSQVAGHWKRTLKKDAVTIEALLYTPFSEAQFEALHAAADEYGAFLGVKASVVTTAP
jgi:hypothetical protein